MGMPPIEVREQGVVLLDRRDDGVAKGEGSLGKPEHECARQDVLPPEARQRELGQPESEGHLAELVEEGGLSSHRDHRAE